MSEVSADRRARALEEVIAEMRHELYRIGNHPALGVDRGLVQRWAERLAALDGEGAPASQPDETNVQILRLFVKHLELHGWRAFPCRICGRDGIVGVHHVHTALSDVLHKLETWAPVATPSEPTPK